MNTVPGFYCKAYINGRPFYKKTIQKCQAQCSDCISEVKKRQQKTQETINNNGKK